jgi:hypothetical protein
MKCAFCDATQFGLVINNNLLCFSCMIKIKKFVNYAPNPFQDELLTEAK